MLAPALDHRLPHRQPVGGAVREAHPRSRGADLHERLREVRRGVLHALVRRRDAQPRAVVVRAVVQPAAPSVGGLDDPRYGHRAGSIHNGLRGLDLYLEPQRTLGQPVRLLQRAEDLRRHRDLLDRRHLRQRHHEPRRQVTAVQQGTEEQVQRADPPPPGRPLEALEPDTDKGGASPAARTRPHDTAAASSASSPGLP